MRPSTKEALKTSLWIPVVVAILTLGLGIVISEVQTKVGWLALLSALGICLGIFFCAFYVLVRKVCPISVDVVEGITRRMNQYVEKGAVTWLLTDKQLVEHERTLPVDEIWLVSSDLATDIPGSPYYDVVRQNLEKGVRYRYFIPRSLAAEARAHQLLETHRNRGDLKIVNLSDEFFFLGPRLDFAIYDPLNRRGLRCGYMQLPVESSDRLHARMDLDLLDNLIGKLHAVTGAATHPEPLAHPVPQSAGPGEGTTERNDKCES